MCKQCDVLRAENDALRTTNDALTSSLKLSIWKQNRAHRDSAPFKLDFAAAKAILKADPSDRRTVNDVRRAGQ